MVCRRKRSKPNKKSTLKNTDRNNPKMPSRTNEVAQTQISVYHTKIFKMHPLLFNRGMQQILYGHDIFLIQISTTS